MEKIKEFTKKHKAFVFFLMLAFFLWLLLIFGQGKRADEKIHKSQIDQFVKGKYHMLSGITNLPGYHVSIALISKPMGVVPTTKLRIISFLLSIGSVWTFFLIARKLGVEDPFRKTLQFVFLPVSFVYFPMLYTDIYALLWLLLAFYFTLKKKYNWSAFFSLVSILIRQTNIVWALFIWVYEYFKTFGFSISLKNILSHIQKTIGFIFLFLAFAAFFWFNKGISFGDRINQQAGFHLGNVYLFLAICGVIFLPLLIDATKKIKMRETKKSIIFGTGVGILIATTFLLFTPALHPYNLKMEFLRNIILDSAYHQYASIYALVIILGCIAIFSMRFEKIELLLFPFAILCLVPSFLVEQRYSIVPLVFILLFRKELGGKTEFSLVIYFLVISSVLVGTLLGTNLFL